MKTMRVDNVREELQQWMENEVRKVKDWSVNREVAWEDIEELANGDLAFEIKHPKYNRSIHWIHSDCVGIDHMSSEILKGDFTKAMEFIKRYRGIVLSWNFASEGDY